MDLTTAITSLGRVENNLVKVDDFMNHKVDPDVMRQIGIEMAAILEPFAPDLLLTAEASGIPPAMSTSLIMGKPMVYAKKYLGTGDRYSYGREVTSPTKGVEYRVEVARRVLQPGLRIAVIDDILSQGRTAEVLGEIVEEALCEVAVFVFAMEKSFMDGRALLEQHGWPVHALTDVTSIEGSVIALA